MKNDSSTVRVNVGADDYTDSNGAVWESDRAYTPGAWGCRNIADTDILSTTDPIRDTDDPELFRHIRFGEEMTYRFDVPPGKYTVRLLFAEIYWESDTAECQDIYVQGKRIMKDFNIFDDAGHDTVFEKKTAARATDGAIEIKLVGRSLPMHSGARVSAIEIHPEGTTNEH